MPSLESKSKESTKFKPSKENTKAKITMPEILQFELVSSALFEGDFTVKPEKHLLITEASIINGV